MDLFVGNKNFEGALAMGRAGLKLQAKDLSQCLVFLFTNFAIIFQDLSNIILQLPF